jgi:AraC-like DNA-binding protein
MQANLNEPLDLEHLALVAAISKFHLVRVFNELTGTTPHHFLACLRVQRAKELLLLPEASITDVCFEVGYSSLGTFSKTFSSLVGVSPQEFRAMPRKLSIKQFAMAVWSYLANRHEIIGAALEGRIEGPPGRRGFIFVGAFDRGVPQGAPLSGTVLLKPGVFRIERPRLHEFHLLAVLLPFSAKLSTMIATLPVGLVANLRIRSKDPTPLQARLQLRPLRRTDPPIVLALPALPPWRSVLAR